MNYLSGKSKIWCSFGPYHEELISVILIPLYDIWILDKKDWLEIRKISKIYDELFQYFIFCKWATLKMQQIIKLAGLARQLFEAVNLPFMKNFDLLVKIANFGAFLLFLGSSVTSRIELSYIATKLNLGRNTWCKSPEKKAEKPQNWLFLISKSKNL